MNPIGPVLTLLVQFLAVLGLLLVADRWLHRHLQGVMFLLTGDEELALWLYAIVLFPGVALHELSHALMARLLGVKIGRMKLLPSRGNKRVQLGFVAVQETDFLRASLIGAAPMVLGSVAVILIGHFVFGTPEIIGAVSSGDWVSGFKAFVPALRAPDVWLWVSMVFAIVNTMLPSRSDVHAWPALAVVGAVVAGLLIYAGLEAVVYESAGRFLTIAVRWVVLLGASTLLVDLPVFAGIFLMQKLLETLKGVRLA